LYDIVDDTPVQLCPRPITPDERVFDTGLVYGAVVEDPKDGLKSVLNRPEFEGLTSGILAFSLSQALDYALELFARDERVRIKDPMASNSEGQHIAETLEDVERIVLAYPNLAETGLMLMPHLARVDNRYTVGRLDLGPHGSYDYMGHEVETVDDHGHIVFGGGDIAVARTEDVLALEAARRRLGIAPQVLAMGRVALRRFAGIAAIAGRVSFDILTGVTDGGRQLTEVVDMTARVGGHDPLKVELIRASQAGNVRVAYGSGRLHYAQPGEILRVPRAGKNVYIDTPTLVSTTEITDITGDVL
jgi:hypothetical protein